MVPSLVSLFILCSLVQEMECNASCLLIIACVIDLYSQPATPHLHVGIFKIKEKVFCSLPENQKGCLQFFSSFSVPLTQPLSLDPSDATDHRLHALFSPAHVYCGSHRPFPPNSFLSTPVASQPQIPACIPCEHIN